MSDTLYAEPIHEFFELSYANYIALPRSVLQSMPLEWQSKFVALIEELDEIFPWRRSGQFVYYRDQRGHYMPDNLMSCVRGGGW